MFLKNILCFQVLLFDEPQFVEKMKKKFEMLNEENIKWMDIKGIPVKFEYV